MKPILLAATLPLMLVSCATGIPTQKTVTAADGSSVTTAPYETPFQRGFGEAAINLFAR